MASTLSDLSIAAVVKSFDSICCMTSYTKGSEGVPSALVTDGQHLTFPDVFLPPAVADVLLESTLRHCYQSCPEHLFKWINPFLDTQKCRLTKVVLPRRPQPDRLLPVVMDFILCGLAKHTLTELSIDPSWRIGALTISKMLSKYLNTFALKILKLRNINLSFSGGFPYLACLYELRVLNLSGTNIGEADLNAALKNMRNLEVLELAQVPFGNLDISHVAETLRYLNLQDVDSRFLSHAASTLKNMPVLQHLDLSLYKNSGGEIPDELIDSMISMPALQSVDLSYTLVDPDQVTVLVRKSKGVELKFLGLLGTSYDYVYPDHLTVTGVSTVKQVVSTLQTQRYHILEMYMTECLREMFKFLKNDMISSDELDIITQIVVLLMKMHASKRSFELAASACLIHLFAALWRGDNRVQTRILQRSCADQILLLLESPTSYNSFHAQLHINCYIFLSVAHEMICTEKYELERIAEVIISNVHEYDPVTDMRRRALRVLRSIVYSLDTDGRTTVGKTGVCTLMKDIVKEKLVAELVDDELEHALSTIWSLTDENVANCCLLASDAFVDDMIALFNVYSHVNIELKIHGGLGNLLEVPSCRRYLMRDDYCSQFVDILQKEETTLALKFDSAHGLVNLAMEGEENWKLNCISYCGALQLVERQVQEWPLASDLRCAYRTFKSQLTLLEESEVPAVHLYSLWTIANFCYYDDERYVPMLIDDQGIPIVKKFFNESADTMCNQGVAWNCQSLASKILSAVDDH